jgi:hypothetical protein
VSLRESSRDENVQRMLGGAPGAPALGRGPLPAGEFSRHHYDHPAAGWGAARSVGHVLEKSGIPEEGVRALFVMDHEDGGFDCPGCAWPDDPTGLRLDLCENGVKHVTWELTRKQVDRDFFAAHTVSELESWSDYDLEAAGRLVEPMRYDPGTDHYVPISREDAFQLVGETLRGLQSPHEASFYTSGRLSNEATFLYQLWVREFGTNNLPDCSNMCHEASGRALMPALGTGKGTVGGPLLQRRYLSIYSMKIGESARRRVRPRIGDARVAVIAPSPGRITGRACGIGRAVAAGGWNRGGRSQPTFLSVRSICLASWSTGPRWA